MNSLFHPEGYPIRKFLFSLSLILLQTDCFGLSYINHFNSQFAGELGLISLGLGKDYKMYSIGGMYGIVPAEVSGGPMIETLALRQTIKFFRWERLSFYLGLNVFHVLDVRYRTESYGEIPSGYYRLGAWRGLIYSGLSAYFNKTHTRAVYFEAGVNDVSIENLYNNFSVMKIQDEISMALGFKQHF